MGACSSGRYSIGQCRRISWPRSSSAMMPTTVRISPTVPLSAMDGHKRVAFMAAYVFLGLNGYEVEASEPEVATIMEGVAAGRISGARPGEGAFGRWRAVVRDVADQFLACGIPDDGFARVRCRTARWCSPSPTGIEFPMPDG
jgi:hypothetical protein